MLMWGSAWDLQGLRKYNDASRQAHGFFLLSPSCWGMTFPAKCSIQTHHFAREHDSTRFQGLQESWGRGGKPGDYKLNIRLKHVHTYIHT